MQKLWQSQAIEAPRISLEFMRHRLEDLRRRVWRRNAFEYLQAAIALPFLIWALVWRFPTPITRVGLALFVAAGVYVTYQWHRRASQRAEPQETGVLHTLAFHRQELVRQRDARKNSWRWYLAPFIPGMIALLVGLVVEHYISWTRFWGCLAWSIFGLVALAVFNERAARRLQQEIDALDSLKAETNAH